MVRRLESRMDGHKFVPSDEPTGFVERPWNTWTYEVTVSTTQGATTFAVSAGNIQSQIRTKCQIAEDGNNLLIKVRTASAWVTAAGLIYPDLQAVFYELDPNGTQSIRSQQRDKGTLNRPAKAGYVFPAADAKEILGSSESGVSIMTATADTPGSIITVRCQVLWQSSP